MSNFKRLMLCKLHTPISCLSKYSAATKLLLFSNCHQSPLNVVNFSVYQYNPSPGSSVGTDVGCQSWVCKFESQLGQYSFRRLTKVTVTSVILISTIVYVEIQKVAIKVCCVDYWCEKARKHKSRWTGRRDMTEKKLKTAFINQSMNHEYQYKALKAYIIV